MPGGGSGARRWLSMAASARWQRRLRWHARDPTSRVYERARQLTEVGARVSLAPNGLRMLDRLGAGDGIGGGRRLVGHSHV